MAEGALQEFEKLLQNYKTFWYLNQKELGDMLEDRTAYTTLTRALNNMGLISKHIKKHNLAS